MSIKIGKQNLKSKNFGIWHWFDPFSWVYLGK
jgi:hypothetical protein